MAPEPNEVTPEDSRIAAFFDLDKTIIATSSATAFAQAFYDRGMISRRSMLRGAYAQLLYLAGSADHDQTERLRQYVSAMSVGWDVEQIHEIVSETLHQFIDPHVYNEALALIANHHQAGHDVIIVSASGIDIVEPIGEMLGADHVVATRMNIEDGKYTGEIEFYAYAEAKAESIRELAAKYGYELAASYAYSDSVTDEPMLSAVGHPVAANPDRQLRKIAEERGWQILDFARPSAPESTDSREKAIVIVAIAVTVAVGAAVAYSLYRRRGQTQNTSARPSARFRRRTGR